MKLKEYMNWIYKPARLKILKGTNHEFLFLPIKKKARDQGLDFFSIPTKMDRSFAFELIAPDKNEPANLIFPQ